MPTSSCGGRLPRVLLDTLVHELNAVRGPARRAGPAGLRRPARGQPHRDAAVREPAGRDPLDRPAGHRPLQDGVRAVRAGPPGDPVVPVAVPAERADDPRDRGRRGRHRAARGSPRRSPPTRAASSASWSRSTTPWSTARDRSTSGPDAMRDIALCQAIIECHRTGRRSTTGRPRRGRDRSEHAEPAGAASSSPTPRSATARSS